MNDITNNLVLNGFSHLECVCCSEHCKQYAFFPDCDPLIPSRPSYVIECEKRITYLTSPQLDLFGGAL